MVAFPVDQRRRNAAGRKGGRSLYICIQTRVDPLCFSVVLLLCQMCWSICIIRRESGFVLAVKAVVGPAPKFTTFLHVHITVLGSCPRINTFLGNNFPSHPNLPVAFPSVEFAMPSLFSQKFKATESKWEIILEFLYFMAEHLLHAQEPVRAVLRPQPQAGFLCGNSCTHKPVYVPCHGMSVSWYWVRMQAVYRDRAICIVCACVMTHGIGVWDSYRNILRDSWWFFVVVVLFYIYRQNM